MAITHVKVTYSVQPRTAQRIQELAAKWGVPKSEVIRRVIDEASVEKPIISRPTPIQALRLLQTSMGMSADAAKKFEREVRLSRRASGLKRK